MRIPSKNRSLVVLVTIALVSLLSACASTGPKGPPPEELIEAVVTSTLANLAAGDIPAVMAAYTEDFTWDQGDKASMDAFLSGAAQGGFLDGMTSNTEAMVTTVDGDTATVSGVTIEGPFGLLDLNFELAQREGVWMITKQSQQ